MTHNPNPMSFFEGDMRKTSFEQNRSYPISWASHKKAKIPFVATAKSHHMKWCLDFKRCGCRISLPSPIAL